MAFLNVKRFQKESYTLLKAQLGLGVMAIKNSNKIPGHLNQYHQDF